MKMNLQSRREEEMRIQKRLFACALSLLALLALGVSALAQDKQPQERPAPRPGDVLVFERELGPSPGVRVPGPPLGDDTLVFLSSESIGGKVVKGAPYSAQAMTETTRTLGDGNRIKRKTSASVYRDGEGRTRRDQELGAVGPWATAEDPQQTIFINDPVGGTNYILDPRTRTARKMPPLRIRFSEKSSDAAPAGEQKMQFRIEREVVTAPGPGSHPMPPPGHPQVEDVRISAAPHKGKAESLGKQIIEGVEAEGTRTVHTIPAGEIGNEQPIQIVSEKWYSPELQTVVMSRHSDPLVGETVYKLTNIIRGEPARTLFEVPSDYTIKEGHTPTRVMRKRQGEEK
jgi:hypothetical protein